ncbi:hypothetical protein CCYA_CCYA03G1007 [Cyanidiococcus yangmingshanensis]|nr:hypothetical protein CCYA_CCYA03G1007 [Cyanidiococcus yangmingshanensis]
MGRTFAYVATAATVTGLAIGSYFLYRSARTQWQTLLRTAPASKPATSSQSQTEQAKQPVETEAVSTKDISVQLSQDTEVLSTNHGSVSSSAEPGKGPTSAVEEPKRQPAEDATSTSSSATPVPAQTENTASMNDEASAGVDEADLAAQLDASLRNIQETGNADTTRERKLLKKLQSIESYEQLSAPCRFVIAQWCHTVFCTRTAAQYNPASGKISLEQAMLVREELKKTYLESAWSLLEMGGFDELAAEAANVSDAETRQLIRESVARSAALKLDIACRMHDAEKMHNAYNDAVLQAEKDGKPIDVNDRLVLLASAALTGRCDEVVRLGGGVGRQELEVLHSAALKDPSMIDYGALYLLSLKIVEEHHRLEKESRDASKSPAETQAASTSTIGFVPGLAWEAYTVRTTRFRLQSKESPSSKSGSAGLANPVPLRPGVVADKWTEQKPHAGVNLIRTGALVHYINPGAVPIPVSGFGTEKEIRLFGYIDVQDQDSKEQMRHMELFRLIQDNTNPNLWRGTETTTLFCVSGKRKGQTLATSILDVEFEMEPDRAAIWRVL